jgi:MFS family permease
MLYLFIGLNMCIHACFVGSRIVVALFALDSFKASPLEIGIMVSLYTIPPWLLGVYAGRVCDRFGARRPMVFGAAFVCAGLLVPFIWPTLPALYILAGLLGTGFVFYNVSAQNITGAMGPREERAKNFSTLSLGYSISSLVGPLAAGYAIDYLSPRIAFLIFAGMALVPMTVLWFYHALTTYVAPKPTGEREGMRQLLRTPGLRRTLILGALVVTGWDLFLFYMPIYGHEIGMTGASIGKVLAVFAVGTFVVRFCMPYLVKRYSARYTLAASVCLGALTFIFFPFIKDPWVLAGLSFVIGIALGCGQPLTLMLAYNRSPVGRTGEVTGMRIALNHGTHSAVPIIAGALGSAFGAAPPFLMIAAILGISGYLATTVTPTAQLKPPDEPH